MTSKFSRVNLEVFGKLVKVARTFLGCNAIQLARELGMRHTTVGRIERGDAAVPEIKYREMQDYLESVGVEFPSGTRDLAIRFDPTHVTALGAPISDKTMPKGVRLLQSRQTTPHDLIVVLQASSVTIEGEMALRQVLGVASDWCSLLVELAAAGQSGAIRLTRPPYADTAYADSVLLDRLRRFPFADDPARQRLVQAIATVPT
ncbi:helix-turn-helix domain-containing protein [Achromobacter aloeverae]